MLLLYLFYLCSLLIVLGVKPDDKVAYNLPKLNNENQWSQNSWQDNQNIAKSNNNNNNNQESNKENKENNIKENNNNNKEKENKVEKPNATKNEEKSNVNNPTSTPTSTETNNKEASITNNKQASNTLDKNKDSTTPLPTGLNTNNTRTQDPMLKCLVESGCGPDTKCIARCAQVPNPSRDQVIRTGACMGRCNTTDHPLPPPGEDPIIQDRIAICYEKCVRGIYLESARKQKKYRDIGMAPSHAIVNFYSFILFSLLSVVYLF